MVPVGVANPDQKALYRLAQNYVCVLHRYDGKEAKHVSRGLGLTRTKLLSTVVKVHWMIDYNRKI